MQANKQHKRDEDLEIKEDFELFVKRHGPEQWLMFFVFMVVVFFRRNMLRGDIIGLSLVGLYVYLFSQAQPKDVTNLTLIFIAIFFFLPIFYGGILVTYWGEEMVRNANWY